MVDILAPYVDKIETIARAVNEFTKSNPVVGGVGILWVAGVVTYLLKQIPSIIYSFWERHFTITVSMHSREETFFHVLRWYEDMGFGKKARTLRVNNGRWGDIRDELIISAGFGHHYFFKGFRPFKLWRIEEKTENEGVKEKITITTIGRSQKPIRDLLKEISPRAFPGKITKLYSWESNVWTFQNNQPARNISSVIISQNKLNRILSHVEQFRDNKDWYQRNGIPYRTGICLSGPPGTGKTSLARALCSYLNLDLYRLSLNFITDAGLEKALTRASSGSLVLIEDIDSFDSTKSREPLPEDIAQDMANEKTEDSNSLAEATSLLTLSGILNAVDGVTASEGRILLMTTNAPEKLDPALLRPGRIDLIMKLDYLNDETFRGMFGRFYPGFDIPKETVWRGKMSAAEFQALVIDNRNNPHGVLKKSQVGRWCLTQTQTQTQTH